MTIWNQLRYFKISENWGSPFDIVGYALMSLDLIRSFFEWNQRFIIHCAFEKEGHSPTGYHPKGLAFDFHIENMGLKEAYDRLVEILENLQLTDVVGIGVYLDWNNPGFHIDFRGKKARWCRIDGKYLEIEKAFE